MLSNVTVFDFETTGLSPQRDQVIEMAAIRCIDGEVVSEFRTMIQFEGKLTAKITEITGITDSMLVGGMDEETAFRVLNRMIGDSLLVAHNAAFDLSFLHFALQRLAGRTFINPFIDTLTISRDRHFYPHKLENMCDRYGIELTGAHRALNDVYGCWELLKGMHVERPVDDYLNRLGYLNKYGPPAWSPPHARLYGTENRYQN
ncbi:3'-5' exonuclease [Paenibacillus sp. FSL L8-0708]|uniref:3'-5' exonuclease n=1 Tax=Paenibacillus sp. FSL L8-0708 TaxID=2975311 RepID=UPI0030F7ABC3